MTSSERTAPMAPSPGSGAGVSASTPGSTGAYTPAADALHVGHITPSSNSVLEPMVNAMQSGMSTAISHHFARIRVEHIALSDEGMSQFSLDPMLEAAGLLADAPADLIVWNGTSGSRSGLASDRRLCAEITERTGAPALTSTTALLDALSVCGLTRYALAVPYTTDVTERIASVYADEGLDCQGTADLGISVNRDMAYVSPDQIRELIRRADSPDADCVLMVCTGVAAAPLAAELERELGKPVIDSVAVTFWGIMRALGLSTRLPGWGALLDGSWGSPA